MPDPLVVHRSGVLQEEWDDDPEDGMYFVGFMLDYESINRLFDKFVDKRVHITIEEAGPGE